MEKHFVTFLSPGTFMSEQTTQEIGGTRSWMDEESLYVEEAILRSKRIKERHGAVPYGFYFSTRERGDDELDSKEVSKSHMYFLGGKVMTRQEIEKQNDLNNEILLDNMRMNGIDRVVVNTNSWRGTLAMNKNDVVLNVK